MIEKSLVEYKKIIIENDIVISFSGFFSQKIIEDLGLEIQKLLNQNNISIELKHNLFSVFIEQTQNINKYMKSKRNSSFYQEILKSGILILSKYNNNYLICSGNLIENNDIPSFIEKIEIIKKMNKNELKLFYKEQILKKLSEEVISAGLGLIDMARKSTYPIKYLIEPYNEKLSYFSLYVLIETKSN